MTRERGNNCCEHDEEAIVDMAVVSGGSGQTAKVVIHYFFRLPRQASSDKWSFRLLQK